MVWNWQHKNWPLFTFNVQDLERLDKQFIQDVGYLRGVADHLYDNEQAQLKIELLREEALSSSKIEGELLDRSSVQSSIQKALGLKLTGRKIPLKEDGVGELSVQLMTTYDRRLTKSMLYHWHALLMRGESRGIAVGAFRKGADPMQIISNRLDHPTIHFEAPPGARVNGDMTQFLAWYNQVNVGGSLLGRAAIAHLYFLAIHPFEDGNGRIARALSEKYIAMSLGVPTLMSLSAEIESERSSYYRELEKTNRTLEVSDWVAWFADRVIGGLRRSREVVDFLLKKTKFFDTYAGQLNARQEKAIRRMFTEGPKGFEGGLSAEKYIKITKSTRATTTRDLKDLVQRGALRKTGELRHTRYFLRLD